MTQESNDFKLRQQFLAQLPGNVLIELAKTSAEKQDMDWLLPMEAAGVFRLPSLIRTNTNQDLYIKQGFPIIESLTFALKSSQCKLVKEDPYTGYKIESGAGIYEPAVKSEFREFIKRITHQLLADSNPDQKNESFNEAYDALKSKYRDVKSESSVKSAAHVAEISLLALACSLGDRDTVKQLAKESNALRDALFPPAMANIKINNVTAISPMVVAMAYGQTEIVKELIDSGWSYRGTCALVQNGVYPMNMPDRNMLQLMDKTSKERNTSILAQDTTFFLPSTLKELVNAWKNPIYDAEIELVNNLHRSFATKGKFFSYSTAVFEAGGYDRNGKDIVSAAIVNENFALADLLTDKFDWKPWAQWDANTQKSSPYEPSELPFARLCRILQKEDDEYQEQEGQPHRTGAASHDVKLDEQVSRWCQEAINNGAGHLLTGSEHNCLATMFAQQGLYRAVSLCIEQGFDVEAAGHGEESLIEMSWSKKELEDVIEAAERKKAAMDVLTELNQLIHAIPG